MDQVDKIAAKLTVLIEGMADHKMTEYHQELLAKEVVADIRSMCEPKPPPGGRPFSFPKCQECNEIAMTPFLTNSQYRDWRAKHIAMGHTIGTSRETDE